jgi:long-chain fatty acid transport protein
VKQSRSRQCCAHLALALALPCSALAEIGPALTGLTGRANDASSVFFSPAGIARLDRPQLLLQTAIGYKQAKFDVDSATYPGGDADSDDQILIIPGAYYVRPLGERWSLGLSVNVPSGIGNDYGKTWSGRYLAKESNLAFVAASAPLAYKITDRWFVAGGPYVIYTDSKSEARVNNLEPSSPDGSVRLEENGADLGFTLGMMFEFTDATRIGITYRSELEPELEGTPTFDNLDLSTREALAALDLLGTEVDVNFKVPAQLQLGLYTEFAKGWSATADLMWINMSEFGFTQVSVGPTSISTPQDAFRDMLLGTAGFKYYYRGNHAISIGALYASSPASDGRRSIALPLDRVIGFGIGDERPCWGFVCNVNLNFFDLGDGKVSEDGLPLTGSIAGSFDENWILLLDIQLKKIF